MAETIQLKITAVWLVLILATGLSWQFGHGFGFGDQYQFGTIAVLVVTFVKVRFVYLDFMELKTAPRSLRLVFEAWALLMCGLLITLYWSGI